jgi:tetrapyrrole methylase family protein/MazG family protein
MEKNGGAAESFGRLYGIVAALRSPGGCPWDREQTPKTLRGNVIEEAYELVEAIDVGDADHVREEAGDLYLLATMIAFMNEEAGAFSVADSLDEASERPLQAATADAVLAQWNDIKEKVEGRRRKDSLLDGVSRALPPLERAYRIQKKAAKAGFDWGKPEDVWAKAREELEEAESACEEASLSGDRDAIEEELGDLLFSAVNLARFLDVDPAVALHRTVEKFSRRFRHVEKRMAQAGKDLRSEHMPMMDGFWEEAKEIEGEGR